MTAESSPTSTQTPSGQESVPVSILAQYIKDFSFENPHVPQIFSQMTQAPEIGVNVNLMTRTLAPNHYEVILGLKMEAKTGEQANFVAELAYGGVFTLPAMPEEATRMFLLVEAPRLLFPYARGIMLNAVRDGGYPHVTMHPIDFMGLYMANQNSLGTTPAAGAA
ncbi:MAG: protein-export chaperone SecB [Alphaproteobacteria bacterium]|nr:protein-export chaperone SecB [Alphaproteobacteria bacterium]MBV8548035.1 protein-export chaperone SecB [Alphaproteobacteria bacterium]